MKSVVLAVACAACLDPPPPPACGVRPLDELDSTDDDSGPWLAPDRLEMFFQSRRFGGQGQGDLYQATRTSVGVPFGAPVLLGGTINTGLNEYTPFVTDDGLDLYFTRRIDTPAPSTPQVFRAHRPDRTALFDPPEPVPGIVGNHPTLSPDLREIWFDSETDGDIHVATRASPSDDFGPDQPLHLTGGGIAKAPSISSDGQTLLFTTNQLGPEVRIVRATRGSLGFGGVTPIDELDPQPGATDRDPQLHRPAFSYPDATIVFASDRPGGTGGLDLWIACE